MTKGYRFLAIAGLWMMQAAYADIGTSTGEQLTTGPDGPGSGVSAKRDPQVCMDDVLKRLGIDLGTKTDPALLASILREDMLLDDFAPARALLAASLAEPVPLRPMLERARAAIVSRQPAMRDFLCAALERDLIPTVSDEKSRAIINRSLHHAFLLDALTEEIVDNPSFMVAIQAHLLEKRAAFGIRGDLVGALEDFKRLYGGRMFEPTKFVSADLRYTAAAVIRQRGSITEEEIKNLQGSQKLSILEAAVTEGAAGFGDNALAGAALAAIPPRTITLDPDTTAFEFDVSPRWTSLFESWHLAFITGNVTHLQIGYPLLFIPSVIGADSQDFLFHRHSALWLTTLFYQFAMLTGKPDAPIPNKQALARLLGQINLPYGDAIAREELGCELEQLRPTLNITLVQIMGLMKQVLSASPLSPEEQARLAALYAD
jgi:hypothetical protein